MKKSFSILLRVAIEEIAALTGCSKEAAQKDLIYLYKQALKKEDK